MGRKYDAPIAEVSGACFVQDRLVIVGDAVPEIAWSLWDDGPGEWTVFDVSDLTGAPKHTGQFEAVEHIDGNVVAVLCEEPALLIAVDLDEEKVVGSWHLEVELDDLRKAWKKDDNSLGEGVFFGPDRVFVIKEKDPSAVVEFGLPEQESLGEFRPGAWNPPKQESLTALAWWEIKGYGDVSDVCVVDDTIWLVSDEDRCIGPMDGDCIKLPKKIDKPEGIARTPEGMWLVAVDNPNGKGALHVLEPS